MSWGRILGGPVYLLDEIYEIERKEIKVAKRSTTKLFCQLCFVIPNCVFLNPIHLRRQKDPFVNIRRSYKN